VRQIAAKAIILSLALIIAAILIAPQVDLDPVAPRLEWAACLLAVFLSWLAAVVMFRITTLAAAALRALSPSLLLTPIVTCSPRLCLLLC
jgi:hypothetical protein